MRRIPSYQSPVRIWLVAVALAILPLPTSAQEQPNNAFGFLRDQLQATHKLKFPDSITASMEQQQEVDRLLSTLLTPAAASQIALYQNPSLRVLYETLPAAAPPGDDPAAALSLRNRNLHATDLQRLLPIALDAAKTYEGLVLILDVAADAERAFYRAVAARHILNIATQIEEAASISAELRRLQDLTGAATKLAVAEAELYEAELSLQTANARVDADKSRRVLIKTLGLSPDTSLQLPDRLPDLPNTLTATAPVQVSDSRPDHLASRWRTVAEQIKCQLEEAKPAEKFRLDERLLVSDSAKDEIEFEVQKAYSNYRFAFEVATVVTARMVPLSRVIIDEKLLEYNGMLIDLTDLVAAARDQLSREMQAVTAQRDFFVARTDFNAAVAGALPPATEAEESSSVDAREITREH